MPSVQTTVYRIKEKGEDNIKEKSKRLFYFIFTNQLRGSYTGGWWGAWGSSKVGQSHVYFFYGPSLERIYFSPSLNGTSTNIQYSNDYLDFFSDKKIT